MNLARKKIPNCRMVHLTVMEFDEKLHFYSNPLNGKKKVFLHQKQVFKYILLNWVNCFLLFADFWTKFY